MNHGSTMRSQGVGNLELDRKTGRRLIGSMLQFAPKAHEERFKTYETMPAIASKFRRRGRSTIFETQADRTDAAIIKPVDGGTHFYGGNEVYLWPKVHGNVSMEY